MINQKEYSLPKLYDCNGNLQKQWYVYFYYPDENGVKKQFKYRMGINRYKNKRERQSEASALITALKIKLDAGWNPFTRKTQNDFPQYVGEALWAILAIKKAFITPRSYKTYYDQINLFIKWLKQCAFDRLYLKNFNNSHARQYCDWLLETKGYCGKTHNSHLTGMKTFFNALVDREQIPISPFAKIKPVRQDTGKITTYSADEETRLCRYMQNEDINFFYATRFVKYAFLRRTELSLLQIKHIRWSNKTIIIPSQSAKSRTQDSITIPKTLEKYILQMKILHLDPEMYLFGKGFIPSENRIKRVDDYSDKQREFNRIKGVKSECTFYSWKHTGAVELYNLTKDPYIVMRQCRHSDIKITMTYLRSLGCGVCEEVRAW